MKIGSHLYVAAMVIPGLHSYEEVRVDRAVQTRYDVHDQTSLIIGEIEELSTQAYVPKVRAETTKTASPTYGIGDAGA
eukprot:4585707-Amphidinium_carterae.1